MAKTPSPFAQAVYDFLAQIPRGKVVTYRQIACAIGHPGAARAVGSALHRNPNPDAYPCYKVVNTKGELAPDFAFGGAAIQKALLESEGIEVVVKNDTFLVNLKKYQF